MDKEKKPTKKSSIKVDNLEDAEKKKNKEEKSPHVEFLEKRQAGDYSKGEKEENKISFPKKRSPKNVTKK